MLIYDEYLTPGSLAEAFAAMNRHSGAYRIVAGCTDTLPWARQGRAGDVKIPVLIDVAKIPELREVSIDDRRVRLGAATPIQHFLDNAALARSLPCMPRCAVWFADEQVRAQATIGGNIVNASPAADVTPALMACDAEVEVATSSNGVILRRRMKLDQFVIGPKRTALEKDELLVAIECDALPHYGGSFEKVGHRRALVISIVCLATSVKLNVQRDRFEDVRLAVGGVGPVPRRLTDVETVLCAGPLNAARLEKASEMSVSYVASRTRQVYRREVVRGFVLRGLISAARRAGAGYDAIPLELETAYA